MSEEMSEKEIKEQVSHTKSIIKEGLESDDDIQLILMRWLDLYQKEKERNKRLEIELEIKKYCKVDELANDLIYYKNLAKEYQGNCVSKDKIREILEYYGHTPADNPDTTIAFYSDIKELLEENNEK